MQHFIVGLKYLSEVCSNGEAETRWMVHLLLVEGWKSRRAQASHGFWAGQIWLHTLEVKEMVRSFTQIGKEEMGLNDKAEILAQ